MIGPLERELHFEVVPTMIAPGYPSEALAPFIPNWTDQRPLVDALSRLRSAIVSGRCACGGRRHVPTVLERRAASTADVPQERLEFRHRLGCVASTPVLLPMLRRAGVPDHLVRKAARVWPAGPPSDDRSEARWDVICP